MQQFLKLPVLVEHFIEHRSETHNLSFKDYIVLHYFDSKAEDGDYERDMQLPFRNHNVILLGSPVIIQQQTSLLLPTAQYFVKDYSIYSVPNTSTNYIAKIWQPPKALRSSLSQELPDASLFII